MLEMIKGCKVAACALLQEEYQTTEYGFCANIHARKIKDVIRSFILLQKSPVFFILELPTNERKERRLRKSDDDPLHKDVYYMDGLNSDEAVALLDQYGELLVQDGISSFGFGAHDSSAEIMSSKYNVVTLFTQSPDTYADFFGNHGIPRVEKCVTAWDTFSKAQPGESMRVDVYGKSVFDLPKKLRKRGLYFAERRND